MSVISPRTKAAHALSHVLRPLRLGVSAEAARSFGRKGPKRPPAASVHAARSSRRARRTRNAGAAAVLLMGAVLSACGSPAATPAAKSSVVVAVSPTQAPNWYFPVISSTAYTLVNLDFIALEYKPLLDVTASDRIDYSRSLASSITVSHHDTVYTIHLGSRYKWSNGTPVTARDVVFTWDVLKAASQPKAVWVQGGSGIGGVPAMWTNVVALNSKTVQVTVSKPVNPVWFIRNGLGQLEPVPASVWDKHPGNMTKELTFIHAVANTPGARVYQVIDGPYHYSSSQPDNYWIYVANPKYGGHRASIQKLVFQYETSTASEFAALRKGTVQLGYVSNGYWGARSQLKNDVVRATYPFGFSYMLPNESTQAPGGLGPYFARQYVREALQMGVNQPGLINYVYHGNGVQSYGPLASRPTTEFDAPALSHALYPYNPAAARSLLMSHGWRLVNGVMTKGGVKFAFTMTYLTGSTSLTNMMEVIQHAWAKEGIQVQLKSMPVNELVAIANQSDPSKWSMMGPMDWTYEPDYYPTGGGLFATGSASNGGGYNSATANTLIKESYAPGSPSQAKAALFRYEEFIQKDNPVIFLPWLAGGYAGIGFIITHVKTLHGTVSTYNPVSGLLYPNYWTLSP